MVDPKETRANHVDPARGVGEFVKTKAQARRRTQTLLRDIDTPSRLRNDLSLDLDVRQIDIDKLKPARRRVRRTDAVQAARLDTSLRTFGFVRPILIDQDNRIVDGHAMWEAARRAGMETVPVIAISHLSSSELRRLTIALSRLGETGQWDEQALALEFAELIELDEDVLVTGFELAEIDGLILDDDGTSAEADVLPEPSVVSTSRAGDIWRLGDHVLIQGDALDPAVYRTLMGQDKERLILTDMPFNVPIAGHVTGNGKHRDFAMASGEMTREQFVTFTETFMKNCLSVLMPGGLFATFIDWRSIELVLATGRALELVLLNLIVWAKTNGGQGSLWRSQHELLPVFKFGQAAHVNNVKLGKHGRWRSNVWSYPGGSSLGSDARDGLTVHPTVKPRALLEDAILDVTNLGDVVIDPFLGSGSTLLAAENTRRRCCAIEIDGGYCDVAILRWQALTGGAALLAETGETFDAVKDRRHADNGSVL